MSMRCVYVCVCVCVCVCICVCMCVCLCVCVFVFVCVVVCLCLCVEISLQSHINYKTLIFHKNADININIGNLALIAVESRDSVYTVHT